MEDYVLIRQGKYFYLDRVTYPKFTAKLRIEDYAVIHILEMDSCFFTEEHQAINGAIEFIEQVKESLNTKVPEIRFSLESVNKWFRLYGQS